MSSILGQNSMIQIYDIDFGHFPDGRVTPESQANPSVYLDRKNGDYFNDKLTFNIQINFVAVHRSLCVCRLTHILTVCCLRDSLQHQCLISNDDSPRRMQFLILAERENRYHHKSINSIECNKSAGRQHTYIVKPDHFLRCGIWFDVTFQINIRTFHQIQWIQWGAQCQRYDRCIYSIFPQNSID